MCSPNFLNKSFLLTRLMRGVTSSVCHSWQEVQISTHTPHARRDVAPEVKPQPFIISTHTPHARRDKECESYVWEEGNFYSHASCEA